MDTTGAMESDDHVDRLRKRLQEARNNGMSWEKATAVPRREWALLRLYTLDLGDDDARDWLAPFDESVADSVLGTDPHAWHASRRREVTQFYFTQFEEIDCLPRVSSMLREAWSLPKPVARLPEEICWSQYADQLFSPSAPKMIAQLWDGEESVEELADRFHIHRLSGFRDGLFEAVALKRLTDLPLFQGDRALFELVERCKALRFRGGRCLGSLAVEILVKRVVRESAGTWQDTWSRQLVPLACDPRTFDAAEYQQWWGWAEPSEMQVAIRGLTGLNIREFIKLLERSLLTTGNEHQFPRRRDFLIDLFDARIIQDAKLVLHNDVYHDLDHRTRRTLQPSHTSGGGQKTSFICLECRDNVYIIEGTHNFGLRCFVGRDRFPIRNFFITTPRFYEDRKLRVNRDRCDLYQVHHQGDWEGDYLWNLRSEFHIDWLRLLPQTR